MDVMREGGEIYLYYTSGLFVVYSASPVRRQIRHFLAKFGNIFMFVEPVHFGNGDILGQFEVLDPGAMELKHHHHKEGGGFCFQRQAQDFYPETVVEADDENLPLLAAFFVHNDNVRIDLPKKSADIQH